MPEAPIQSFYVFFLRRRRLVLFNFALVGTL